MQDDSATQKRRHFTAEEKATILRRHLADKVAVSDLCDEYRIQPSLFYTWQRQAMEHLGQALEDRRTHRADGQARDAASQQQQTIEHLEARIAKKDAIIAFVSEEHLALKKKFGGS